MPISDVILWLNLNFRNNLTDDALMNYDFYISDMLKSSNDDDKRVLCNIAIDLKYNLIAGDCYIEVFKKIDFSSSLRLFQKIEDAFLKVFKDYKASLQYNSILSHNNSTCTSKEIKFARVMDLRNYIKYCVNEGNPSETHLNPDDIKTAKLYIESGALNQRTFINGGKPDRDLVWVVPCEEIENILDGVAVDKRGECACDYLGLKIESPEHKVYILYPAEFGKNETSHHPIALNRNHGVENDFYLSHKNSDDYCGRTRPVSGDNKNYQQKERVHKSVGPNNLYKYDVKYLGVVNINPPPYKIVDNAIDRFL